MLVARAAEDVSFEGGGPGGLPFKPRSEATPQLLVTVHDAEGTLVIHIDHLMSLERPGEVRSEREVRQLLDQLTTTFARS